MRPGKTSSRIAIAALVSALAFVMWNQAADSGFRRGHRGWVSAHTLAVAEKATLDNGLVGYAAVLSIPEARHLYYFDRYPVFFSAGLHAALHTVRVTKATQIQIARQVMNLIYALTLLAAVALLVELGISTELSVAAAAMAGSAYTMVEYRDMVHYDQPALLGSLVLLWAIAGWRNGRGGRRIYLATLFAMTAGRGYASFPLLGLWWVLEVAAALSNSRETDSAERSSVIQRIARSPATRACLLAILVGSACLGYNVVTEARLREVPLSQVSIVQSALRRLSLNEAFNTGKSQRLGWERLARTQRGNLERSVVPWAAYNPVHRRQPAAAVVFLILGGLVAAFVASRPGELRAVWILACLSGPLWLYAMRNLVAFHPYTAVFLLPLALTFFATVLWPFPKRVGVLAALVACSVLVFSTQARNDDLVRHGRGLKQETADMERIARKAGPSGAVAMDGTPFRGVPFALGFYLPNHDIVVEGPATLVISRDENFDGEHLTPRNKKLFLYRPNGRYSTHSALARHHPDSRANRIKMRDSHAPRSSLRD